MFSTKAFYWQNFFNMVLDGFSQFLLAFLDLHGKPKNAEKNWFTIGTS
jgi:hypothetical protein